MPEKERLLSKIGMAKFGMMACCIVMFIPLVGFFVAGGTLASLGSNVTPWAPLLLCAAVHLAMFRFMGNMGKSCHAATEERPALTASSIPAVKPRQTTI